MSSLHIEIDTSLPRLEDGSKPENVRWQTNSSDDCKVYIDWRYFQHLAVLMGTFAKLRTGGELSFHVTWKRGEGLQETYVEQLQDYLDKLAASPRSVGASREDDLST